MEVQCARVVHATVLVMVKKVLRIVVEPPLLSATPFLQLVPVEEPLVLAPAEGPLVTLVRLPVIVLLVIAVLVIKIVVQLLIT